MRALVITNSITKRDSKSVEKYLNDISKYEVLTPEEELKLFQRFRNGDEEAFSEIIRRNLRFVVSVAKQYQNFGLSLNDLINEGNIGLVKAVQRFDETRGFKFISYAVWWIRQMILQAIADKSRKIRLPANQQSTTMKIIEQRNKLLHDLERVPTTEELAEATGLDLKVVQKCLQSHQFCQSLDASMDEDDDYTLKYFLEDQKIDRPDTSLLGIESLRIEIKELLDELNPREAQVLAMFYGIDRMHPASLDEISEPIGVTRERVRQIKDRGLKKLRQKVSRNKMTFSLN